MLNKCTPPAGPVATVPAGTTDTREMIEQLILIERHAFEALAAWSQPDGRSGWHKNYRIRSREHMKARQQLERAQRAAIKTFAVSRGWKYEGGFSVSELHRESLAVTWCEDCGGLCQLDPNFNIHRTHSSGKHDAFCIPSRSDPWRTESVVHHTKHPFAACEVFAAVFGLQVTRLPWSWYGPQYIAALFERRAQR